MADIVRIYDLRLGDFCDQPRADLVVALGNFDGVHIAHQALLTRTVAIAKRLNIDRPTRSAAWCFDPPSSYHLGYTAGHLSTTREKLALLSQCGLDYAYLADFTAVRSLSPQDFVQKALVRDANVVSAVCGFNYRFGKGGSGTEQHLRCILGEQAVEVVAPQYVLVGGERILVSSTAVRAALAQGDAETVTALLGRPYSLTGPVVHGKRLGRTLGLPTINQNVPKDKLMPKSGIYVSHVCFGGETFDGVTNVGHRPTVDGSDATVNCETHILDLDRDLYGETVTVEFLHRLRDEQRFDSVQALKAAIQGDVAAAKQYFER